MHALLLGVLLAVLTRPIHARCDNGPYIFDDSCRIASQGIGSSMNRMKHLVLLAHIYNATIIANPVCFRSDEHKTDLLDFMGWEADMDCSATDVYAATEYSDEAAKAGETVRITVTDKDEEMQKNGIIKEDNGELDKVCRMLHEGDLPAAQVARIGFGPGTFDGNSLFPQMNYHSRAVSQLPNRGKTVIYMTRNRYLMEGYMCQKWYIRDKWENKMALQARARQHNPKQITIAFHLRHGDVTTKDINWLDPWKETRSIPLRQGVDVLAALLSNASLLSLGDPEDVAIKLYSEGNASEFTQLTERFPQTQLIMGDNSTLEADMHAMATADLLLASPSSFTSLLACLNKKGLVLTDWNNPEKFEGIDNRVEQKELLAGELRGFNKRFCQWGWKLPAAKKQKHLCDLQWERSEQEKEARRREVLACIEEEDDRKYQLLSGEVTAEETRDGPAPVGSLLKGHELHSMKSMRHLHLEIKRLRKRLNKLERAPPKSSSGSGVEGVGLHKELQSSSRLWRHFSNETDRLHCSRNAAEADARTIDDTICTGQPPASNDERYSMAMANLRLSYFVRRVASVLVTRGFELPVYVVSGPKPERRQRLGKNFAMADIPADSVTWESGYLAHNLTQEDKDHFANDYDICRAAMPQEEKACRGGFVFRDVEMSVALKHVHIVLEIAARAKKREQRRKEEGMSFEEGPHGHRWSLVIEDDQYLPVDIKRQVVEVLLQTESSAGMVMLDDSFYWIPFYQPPPYMDPYPFPRPYEKNFTRTLGAYLISDDAAMRIAAGTKLLPIAAPIDHHLNFAVHEQDLGIQWVFPPLTCAGSQGVSNEVQSTTGGVVNDEGDRNYCHFCCNRYYNTSSLLPLFAMAT